MRVKKLSCPNCNAKVERGQAECEYCGATLVFEEKSPEQTAPTVVNATINVTQTPPTPQVDEREIIEQTRHAQDVAISEAEMELAYIADRNAKERKHRIVSSVVSGITGLAGVVSGIFLINQISYLGIILIVLGILCLCKIFYTFMRTSYNMTRSGYIYSAVICALISGFGIYGGIELIILSPKIDGKLMCIIPFLLACVSISYFITKTVYYIRNNRQ